MPVPSARRGEGNPAITILDGGTTFKINDPISLGQAVTAGVLRSDLEEVAVAALYVSAKRAGFSRDADVGTRARFRETLMSRPGSCRVLNV